MFCEGHIISELHGLLNGALEGLHYRIFLDDVKSFGSTEGVYIYDYAKLNPPEINRLMNLGEGSTTIGEFCNSGDCLAPFK